MEENRNKVVAPLATDDSADNAFTETYEGETSFDADPEGENGRSDREEYEELIKNRFKDLYAEDTQRLINRRFRKYKIMEERYKIMEDSLAEKEAKISESEARIAELSEHLRTEIERAVKETEERVIAEIKAKKLRPEENGAVRAKANASFDVSTLSKNDRAALAKRAAGGERIKF